MPRQFAVVCALTLTLSACSGGDNRTVASTPTTPSGLAAAAPGGTGVSGPAAMPSPARNETVDFRNQLETKYQTGLRSSAVTTAVDREGEVIWIQEYIRYRVSGCDHGTAVQRVMTQIDTGVAGPDCGATPTGSVAVPYPSRADVVAFRQQLETRYQQMNRGLVSTFVDAEGAAIWTSEYLRYRNNDCDHATAVQKVMTQIDGNAAPATCVTVFAACSYRFSQGGQDVPSAGGDFFVDIHKLAGTGACTWTVTNLASSFVSQVTPTTGEGFGKVTFRVARNDSARRTGSLRFTYEGGSISHEIAQASSPYTVLFNMVDSNRSSSATTSCEIRGTATPCTFTASADLPGALTYNWRLVYSYGIDKTITQSGSSNSFVLTEGCGGANSTTDGFDVDLSVTMTVRNDRGEEATVRSGEGSQPTLRLKTYRC
jgi:hypothetical protein